MPRKIDSSTSNNHLNNNSSIKLHYNNGDSYIGLVSGEKRSGKGTYTFKNGFQISGKWANDQILKGSKFDSTGKRFTQPINLKYSGEGVINIIENSGIRLPSKQIVEKSVKEDIHELRAMNSYNKLKTENEAELEDFSIEKAIQIILNTPTSDLNPLNDLSLIDHVSANQLYNSNKVNNNLREIAQGNFLNDKNKNNYNYNNTIKETYGYNSKTINNFYINNNYIINNNNNNNNNNNYQLINNYINATRELTNNINNVGEDKINKYEFNDKYIVKNEYAENNNNRSNINMNNDDATVHNTVEKKYDDGVYLGRLVNNKREGEGTFTYLDGAQISGNWQKDALSFGTLITKYKTKYIGPLVNGLPHGDNGNFYSPDGVIHYICGTNNGKLHGLATHVDPKTNKKIQIYWINGVPKSIEEL